MEEQASWKGHSFTLLVFVGIVFLCSIFFVLGMLVGRGQGQRSAEAAEANTAAKLAAAEARSQAESEKTELSYQVLDTGRIAKLSPPPVDEPVKSSPPVVATPPKPAPAPKAAKPSAPAPKAQTPGLKAPAPISAAGSSKMTYVQVNTFEKLSSANQQIDQLQKQGFHAIVSSGEGSDKLYRVRVGPFSNDTDADAAKRKLESMGYKPIKK